MLQYRDDYQEIINMGELGITNLKTMKILPLTSLAPSSGTGVGGGGGCGTMVAALKSQGRAIHL